MRNFAWSVIALLFVHSLLFSSLQPTTTEPDNLVAKAKEFVLLLEQGEFTKAVKLFDDVMSKAMSSEQLKKAWQSLTTQAGAFKKQTTVRKQISGKYDIVFITCQFEKTLLDIKVVFDKNKQIAGLWFVPTQSSLKYSPPSYVNPSLFQEKEVKVGSGEYILPGTLTLPEGDGPFQAVVLVHGSGPLDRDESIGPNKPFRDLAWGLASKGIAVLRYEKRTKAYGKKLISDKKQLTVKEETIDDALAACQMLRNTERIDVHQIFVLGHSLGGMLIPRIAALDSKITGFIIMAGATRPLEDVILEQLHYIFSIDGQISGSEKEKLAEIKAAVDKIKNLKTSEAEVSEENILGAPPVYWLDLHGYNPAQAAKNIKQPLLILQGGRDYQVTREDFNNWKKALSARKNVTFKFYPQLNHLFMAGKGKITPAEYNRAGHISKAVIEDIAHWIKMIAKK